MNIEKAVFEVMEELLGLSEEDLAENMDIDLWEEGLLDSVGSAMMIANLENKLNVVIDLDEILPDDFSSVNSIIRSFKRLTVCK